MNAYNGYVQIISIVTTNLLFSVLGSNADMYQLSISVRVDRLCPTFKGDFYFLCIYSSKMVKFTLSNKKWKPIQLLKKSSMSRSEVEGSSGLKSFPSKSLFSLWETYRLPTINSAELFYVGFVLTYIILHTFAKNVWLEGKQIPSWSVIVWMKRLNLIQKFWRRLQYRRKKQRITLANRFIQNSTYISLSTF